MKVIRASLVVLTMTMISVTTFYLWAVNSWYNKSDYYAILDYHDAVNPKDTLTVMTYNLGYLSGMTNNLAIDRPMHLFNSNLTASKNLLSMISPDIIGFQEIDFNSSRSYHQNQLDSIGMHLGYYQAYGSVNWDKNYVPFPYWPVRFHFGKMLSGQAILSRYPLTDENTIVLEKPINAPFYYNAFYLDRLIQMVDVKVGQRVVKVMNLHMEAFDVETREKQAIVVREVFDQYADKMPVILMGDFNSKPDWVKGSDRAMTSILSPGNIASAISKERYMQDENKNNTFSTEEPYQMIDYILYNPKFIRMVDSRVVIDAGKISDHFPVSMRFIIK